MNILINYQNYYSFMKGASFGADCKCSRDVNVYRVPCRRPENLIGLLINTVEIFSVWP